MTSQPTRAPRPRAASLGAIAAVLTAALILASTASAHPAALAGPSSTSASTTLTWGLQSTIASLNWIKGWTINIPPALTLAMDGLLTLSPNEQIQPDLAVRWKKVSPTVYRFYLRHGVKFWDGHPLTAADVEASYGYIADASTASPLYTLNRFNNVKYVITRGKYTVEIRLKQPDTSFLYQVTEAAGWVTEGAFLKAHINDMGTPGALVMGTGPYEITSFSPDQSVTYKRNPHYWGKPGRWQHIVLQEIPDATTRQLAVQSGQLDGSLGVVPGTEAQWQNNGVTTTFGPDNFIDVISFNTTAAPWSDVHVRKMVQYAIDRDSIVKNVLGGHVTPANWLSPPPYTGWGGLLPVKTLNKEYAGFSDSTFSMAKAKAELAASSVPNGFKATVYYPDNHPENGALALALAQNLKTIGVTLTVQKITYPAWVARAFGHSGLGMEFAYLGMGYYDPSAGVNNFINSSFARANALNLANYNNASVDSSMTHANDAKKTEAERGNEILTSLKAVHTDLPYITLWWGKVGVAVRKGLTFKQPLGPPTFGVTDWANNVAPSK